MRIFGAFVRRINLRYWARHRLRTALTVLGVTTGVTLVVAIAVINSTLLTTVEDSARSLAGNADIEVASADSSGLGTEALKTVSEMEGVEITVPMMRTYTQLRGDDGTRRVLIMGTTYDFHHLFHDQVVRDGSLDITARSMTLDGVFLSTATSEALGVQIGDQVEAETSTGPVDVELAGTFSGSLVDALETGDIAIMPLAQAQETFDRVGRVDSIYVLIEPGADAGRIEREISSSLGPFAIVGSPGARVAGFEETLNGIATLTSLAGTVALFVSAFVVFNTMSMSIVERRREISLALALGATRRQVIGGFVGEAAVLGSIACILGIVCGSFLADLMVQPGLDGLRVFGITAVAGTSLEWFHVLLGFASGVGVSIVASYLPARRVAKVAPVEALRPQGAYQALPEGSQAPTRATARWIAGLILIGGGIAAGPLTHAQMETATWTTNAILLSLLCGCTLILPSAVRGGIRLIRAVLPRAAGVSARLAVDSLHRNSGRTTITVGALVFTLGIVIAVGGSLDSYKAQWFRSARAWYGAPVQINSPSFVSLGSDQPLPPSLEGAIRDVDGVEDVYRSHYRIVNMDGRQTTIYVVPYVEQTADPRMPSYGSGFRSDVAAALQRDEIVISSLAEREKGVGVGDVLEVPTPSGPASFRVGGVVSDLNPLDSLFMSNEMFVEHWSDRTVDGYALTLEEGANLASVMTDVRRAADEAGIPALVRTREELIDDTFAPIDQMFSVARAVQLAALLVAALAIANTMFITVLERKWELGLQRAVGMDGGSVARTLLSEAGVIGLIGGLGAWVVGLATGYLMVADIEHAYAFSFPFEIPIDLMAITLVLGGVIALAAGAYPSRTALRTPIIEALRYE